MIQVKGFRDCIECGAKCCKILAVPAKYDIFTTGVPLELYGTYPPREGVTVIGDRFFVSRNIRTEERDIRLGKFIIIHSKCSELIDVRCGIYKDRPEICRNFVASTAWYYLVPAGCIFEPGFLGEDLGIQ